jgi:hypothetical protein
MSFSRTKTELPAELKAKMEAIRAKAREYGLDFFEVVYEVPGAPTTGLF